METKQWKIWFSGNSLHYEIIEAENLKSAKWIFASKSGINSICYVRGGKL